MGTRSYFNKQFSSQTCNPQLSEQMVVVDAASLKITPQDLDETVRAAGIKFHSVFSFQQSFIDSQYLTTISLHQHQQPFTEHH